MTLVMDLYRRPAGRDKFSAAVTFDLMVDGSDAPRSERVEISGRVRRGLVVQPECHLGRFSERATNYGTVTVPVTSPLALKSLIVETPDADVTARVVERAMDGTYRVEVGLAGRHPCGSYVRRVVLTATTDAGLAVPAVTVPVTAEVVDDIEAEPRELVSGGRRVGELDDLSVALRSLTGSGFRIERVTADGPGLEVVGWGATDPNVRLRRRTIAAGQQTCRARIVVRSDERTYEVVVPVISYGVAATDR